MKQQMISAIAEKLAALGVSARCGGETDIAVSVEFLDAKWSSGSGKIRYEAMILANERERTVYMYEKTTETGSGLNFGMRRESSFQSGGTLFRKVKSVQYGPDGKAFECAFDLGAIPKAVREIAKSGGWKFKIVLNKGKAMHPAGG